MQDGENGLMDAYLPVVLLVNGPATNEFEIKRGVREDVPLSSFIFVIAMESLSISLKEICNKHIFQGIYLLNNGPILSFLLYAND